MPPPSCAWRCVVPLCWAHVYAGDPLAAAAERHAGQRCSCPPPSRLYRGIMLAWDTHALKASSPYLRCEPDGRLLHSDLNALALEQRYGALFSLGPADQHCQSGFRNLATHYLYLLYICSSASGQCFHTFYGPCRPTHCAAGSDLWGHFIQSTAYLIASPCGTISSTYQLLSPYWLHHWCPGPAVGTIGAQVTEHEGKVGPIRDGNWLSRLLLDPAIVADAIFGLPAQAVKHVHAWRFPC